MNVQLYIYDILFVVSFLSLHFLYTTRGSCGIMSTFSQKMCLYPHTPTHMHMHTVDIHRFDQTLSGTCLK